MGHQNIAAASRQHARDATRTLVTLGLKPPHDRNRQHATMPRPCCHAVSTGSARRCAGGPTTIWPRRSPIAAVWLYPNADHSRALAVGGHATADDNLICSCTTCNERKGSREGWQPIVTSERWDGCVPLLAPLYDLAGAERATLTKAIVDWLDAARQAHPTTGEQLPGRIVR